MVHPSKNACIPPIRRPKPAKSFSRLLREFVTGGNISSKDSDLSDSSVSSPRCSSVQQSDIRTAESSQDSGTSYKWIDNRRYLDVEGVQYIFPTDADEIDRQIHLHYLVKTVFKGIHEAPVKERLVRGARVLDIGCGSGIWCMEMATEYPESDFHGIDIADGFPNTIKPKNCNFTQWDVLRGLPFPDNSFDFVFQRWMSASWTKEQWIMILQEIYRVTKPGGWVELWEIDHELQDQGIESKAMTNRVLHAMQTRGLDPFVARRLGSCLSVHGFLKVRTNFMSLPIYWGSSEGQVLSKMNGDIYFQSLNAIKPWLTAAMNIDSSKFDAMVANSIQENIMTNSYLNYHVTYGQKPKSKVDSVPKF